MYRKHNETYTLNERKLFHKKSGEGDSFPHLKAEEHGLLCFYDEKALR